MNRHLSLTLTLCLLFGLYFLSTQFDQYISIQMETSLRSPEGMSEAVWLWGVASFLNSFLFPPLWTLIFLFKYYFNLSLEDTILKMKALLNQTYIEILRSWGKIFQWSFAFIIPGIIRWFQYSFVPLIVTLDPAYNKGERDALEYSRTLYRKRWVVLTVLIIGTWIIYPMISSSVFDEYRIFWIHSGPALLIGLTDFFVTCFTTYWIIRIFLQINKEVGNELTVSMERH